MAEVLEKPKLDVGAIREAVGQLIQLRGLKQVAVARESGISSAALSRFLTGQYEGDNVAVATKLFAWKENVARRDGVPGALMRGHGFVATSAAGRIAAGLGHAQATADLVVVIGAPGVGKTVTLENFRQTGSSVWLATMSPDTSGKVPMLEELGFAMGLNLTGGAAKMRREIAARVRNTGGLIVIDEAQHLDARAIETLRGIHDATRTGMVLCGNPKLLVNVSQLSQVYSRVGRKVTLGKPSRADVVAVLKQFDIAGRDECEFLHTLSQHPGGLRCVIKAVRLAILAAGGEDTPAAVGMEHLAAAWSELALEDEQ